jgi:hypothetical protein
MTGLPYYYPGLPAIYYPEGNLPSITVLSSNPGLLSYPILPSIGLLYS